MTEKITLTEWIKRAVWLLFTLIIGYLLIASIFSSCYTGNYRYFTNVAANTTEINVEHTFYLRDFYFQHIFLFVFFSFILLFLRVKKQMRDVFYQKYFTLIVCILAGILSLIIVFAGQLYPKFDQRSVMEVAASLQENDLSVLNKGEYLFMYPHQMGIVMYFQILSVIFGNANYVAFEAVNVIWIILSYYILVKLTGILWRERQYESGVAVLCLLFLPYLFYVTFLYGTVVGLTFALLSFYTTFLYEKTENHKFLAILYLSIASLSMGIACVIKNNYQIFLAAVLIYLLFSCFPLKVTAKEKICRKLLLFFTLIICCKLCSFGVSEYRKSLNDGVLFSGLPMTTYVAMGLQDGKAAPGWYNGYNNTIYAENDFDYEKTDLAARVEIKRIISGYPKDIVASISFFVKKISSQWNNPTFQSLWIQEDRSGSDGLLWILSGNGRYIYTFFVNLLHTWILAGTLVYAVLRIKSSSLEEIVLPVTFIGGFIFHFFWEAKSIYAMPHFLLLLPLCICGYGQWRQWMLERKAEIVENGWKSEVGLRLKKKIVTGLAIVIVICAVSYTDLFAKMFARNEDSGVFNTYSQEMVDEALLVQ